MIFKFKDMKEILAVIGIFIFIVIIFCINQSRKEKGSVALYGFVGFFISILGSLLIFIGFSMWDDLTFPKGKRQFKVEIYQKSYDIYGKVVQKESRYAIYYEFPFRRKRYIKIINFNDLLDKEKPLYYKHACDHYYYKPASTFTLDEANVIAKFLNDKNRIVIEKTD